MGIFLFNHRKGKMTSGEKHKRRVENNTATVAWTVRVSVLALGHGTSPGHGAMLSLEGHLAGQLPTSRLFLDFVILRLKDI